MSKEQESEEENDADARYEAREAEIAADDTLTLLREAMNWISRQNHDATELHDWKPMFESSEALIYAIDAHLWKSIDYPQDSNKGEDVMPTEIYQYHYEDCYGEQCNSPLFINLEAAHAWFEEYSAERCSSECGTFPNGLGTSLAQSGKDSISRVKIHSSWPNLMLAIGRKGEYDE